MVVYIVVIAVLIVLLVASFRALSGGEVLTEDDYRTVLVSLTRFADARGDELAEALAGPRPGNGAGDPAAEVAAGARKKLAGYQQQLSRFEGAADQLGSARALLSAAIEDLGWACRLVEPGTYWDNPGIQEAVACLRRHAGRCLEEVSGLLATPATP
ncbi:MAG: hypothetical protein NVSMB29_13570 [Candidatus Dormibacteria bacterium]